MRLGLYKILFYFGAIVQESTILLSPPPICMAHPSVYYCTIITQYTIPFPISRLYAIHHTKLIITISCKGALCAYVIRLLASYNQTDETLRRNSLIYMSKANLPIAVN